MNVRDIVLKLKRDLVRYPNLLDFPVEIAIDDNVYDLAGIGVKAYDNGEFLVVIHNEAGEDYLNEDVENNDNYDGPPEDE